MVSSPQTSPHKAENAPTSLSGRKHRYSSSTGRSSFWDDIIRAEEERAGGSAVENVEETLFEGHHKRSKHGVGSLALEQHAIAQSAVVPKEGELSSPKSLTRRRQHSFQGGNTTTEIHSGNSSPVRTAAEDDELERSGGSESSIVIYDDEQNLSDDEEPTRRETTKSAAPTSLRLDLSRVNSNAEASGKLVQPQAEPKLRPHATRQRPLSVAYGPQLRAYRKAIGQRYLTPIMGDNPRAFVITTIEAMYFSGNTLYSQKWMLRYKNAPQLGALLSPWPSAPKSSLPDDFNPAELDDEIEVAEDEPNDVDSNNSTPRRASAPSLGIASAGVATTSGTNTPPSPSSGKRYPDSIGGGVPTSSGPDAPLRSSQSISTPTISPRVIGKLNMPNQHGGSSGRDSPSIHANNQAGALHSSIVPLAVIDTSPGSSSQADGDSKPPISHLAKTANDLSSKRQTATTNLFTGILSRFKGRPTLSTPPTTTLLSGNQSSAAGAPPSSSATSTSTALTTTGNGPNNNMNQVALGTANASVLARLKDKLRPWDRRRTRLRTSDPSITAEGLTSDIGNSMSVVDDDSGMMSNAQDASKPSLRKSLALPLNGLLTRKPLPSGVMSDEEEVTDTETLEETLDEEGDLVVRRLRRSGARFNRSRSRSALTSELKTDAIRGPYFQRLQGMSSTMKDMTDRMHSMHESAENSLAELHATLERLNHGHDRLDIRFKKLSRQMEDTRNKAQSANALLVDNIQKSSNAIAHLKFKSRARGPMRVVFAVLGWVVLLVGTLIWLVAATYRAIARGIRWVRVKFFPSTLPPPQVSKRPTHPTRRQGSVATDSSSSASRMINITLGKQNQGSASGSPKSARSGGAGYGHRRSMSSSAAANYHENSLTSAPLSPTSLASPPSATSPSTLASITEVNLDGSNMTRPNVPGVREGSFLRMSDDSGTSSSVNSTIAEEDERDFEDNDSDEDDLATHQRRGTNLSSSSFTSTSSGTSATTGTSVTVPVTSFAPNAAAAHVEAQQLQTLEDMSRSIKALRMQDKAAKRKAAAEKQAAIKPTLL